MARIIMLFGWFRKRRDDIPTEERIEWSPAGKGMVKNILAGYPDGLVIYCSFDVVGITFRFVDAATFANSQRLSVELEREPTNKRDRNAIQVQLVGPKERKAEFEDAAKVPRKRKATS
jgi:hypothetical protein